MAVLENCESDSLLNVFKNWLDLDIKNIKFENSMKLHSIEEYKFWVHKATITLKNGEKLNSFIRLIEKDKIKESIYCYWNLLMEQMKNEESYEKFTDNEISIVEAQKDNYKNTILLELDTKGQRKNMAQIYLIDTIKYFRFNSNEIKNIEQKNDNRTLFVGLQL